MQKAGILGGGQLGRMLLQQAANYPVETYVLENDPECPAAHLCHHFVRGDIRNYDDVYRFGKNLDALTIEIESVNTEALEKLASEGVTVVPSPAALRVIKNKVTQKQFYRDNEIPSAEFVVVQNAADVREKQSFLPAVQKLAEGGYDGRGVQVIASPADLLAAFDAPGLLEKKVDIQKEISVIACVNKKGDTALFPPVEMVFDPALNLLDYQICPAGLPEKIMWRIEAIASKVARCLKSPGLFAVELFVDNHDMVYVNETAPRVHNSGHHTIEANYSSQYDMLWRILLDYPLGNTGNIMHAALVNIIGEPAISGNVEYQGLQDVLAMDNAFVHLYGKKETRPGRKMGHVTLIGGNNPDLIRQAHLVKGLLKATS